VVQKVLEQDEKKSTLICCMLWSWWWRRNKINAGETAGTVDNLVYQIKHLVNDSLQFCRSRGTTETEKNIVQWSKPEGEWLKINTDGSFMQATREGGWGFVVRDSAGEVRGSGVGYLANTTSAAHAEAEACTQALQAAATWGMVNVQVETDAQNLVEALRGQELDLAPEGVVYRDLRIFIRLNFNSVKVSYAPRSCNNVAHALADYGARRRELRQLWPESLPNDVIVRVVSGGART
jgi:ribonuclease HI